MSLASFLGETSKATVATLLLAFVLATTCTVAGQSSRAVQKPMELEKSEFLRRAAKQPVLWYPLGKEALDRARKENKPLLIEVGAIWCPFCEAMDRDSYLDSAVADFINAHFVAVRIDYDEQPELSHRLELAQALANLPSGMPLTMVVTPEGKLYAGGGFSPSVPTKHKPSFMEFLRDADHQFRTKDFSVTRYDVNGELKAAR